MNELRFGSALTAIAMATMLGGCVASQTGARSASIFGKKVDSSNIGLATRALVALNANDPATAVRLAERAVENTPNDAGFRALLGNAYFASGRFESAGAAFRDSLSLISNQPKVVLKLALAETALGRRSDAVALLQAARELLDVSDFGLAMALAGQPQQAVAVLEPAARERGADARLRQNLALAHGLAGDWEAARIIAAQDVSADVVEARVREWMSLATPARPADQVAALTGIVPAASDPGQPVRLALRRTDTRQAEAAPPAPVALPQVTAQVSAPVPPVVQPAPVAPVAEAAPAPEAYYAPSAPVAEVAAFAPAALAPEPAFIAPEPTPVPVRAVPAPAPAAKAARRVAKLVQKRPAALPVRHGQSTAVVQIGAYGSPERVATGWSTLARRHALLRGYAPMSARFQTPKGAVYRLSVRGFANAREALQLCASLRSAGGKCFVRSVAGDAPVRLASR